MSKTPKPTQDEIDAYAFVASMVPKADNRGVFPMWHGWALREAYLAGVRAERERQRAAEERPPS